MNARMQTLHRPGRRIAELDPFGVEADVKPGAGYGCVDWYAYPDEPRTADSPAPKTQPKVITDDLGQLLPPEAQARAQPH